MSVASAPHLLYQLPVWIPVYMTEHQGQNRKYVNGKKIYKINSIFYYHLGEIRVSTCAVDDRVMWCNVSLLLDSLRVGGIGK